MALTSFAFIHTRVQYSDFYSSFHQARAAEHFSWVGCTLSSRFRTFTVFILHWPSLKKGWRVCYDGY